MHIEKLSDKQIKCTLTPDDLLSRHINIGELTYGSERARSLFQEMLTRAYREFNFQSDNMPLMIEAVPISEGTLVLLITKVDDPDEIDTRFSKFAPVVDEDDDFTADFSDLDDSFCDSRADEILEEFERLCAGYTDDTGNSKTLTDLSNPQPDFFRVYSFSSIDDVCRAAGSLRGSYDADNSLYKDIAQNTYYLVLHKGEHSPQTFNKICNIMSEYAQSVHSNPGTEAYYQEHFKPILAKHALQSLELI